MKSKREENAPIAIPQLLLVAAQLALGLWVMWRFGLQPMGRLTALSGTAIIGAPVVLFLVHALLPLPARKPLLLAGTAWLVHLLFGATAMGYVIGGGLVLIGICHLPIGFRWRVLIIVAVATVLALVLGRVIEGKRLLMIALPVLGSIFMFRLVMYLYDIRHEKPGDASVIDRISYFFLLPAPLFPFFPTLDYKVYLRCFYARPAFEIYQTGVLWISRGVVHLVLYRVIYQFFSPPAEYVVDLGGVMAFCLSGYLIYLRVSGESSTSSGDSMRLVCGYDLPETHRLYFFASPDSATTGCRINIYWKDFMAKIFFFPTFSKLRRTKLSSPVQVAVAIAVVFVATTILHAYQTFWLRGQFAIHETDYWFWGLLGVLVIISTHFENKRPSGGLPGKREWSAKAALTTSAKATGMFVFLCVLWALWSAQTLDNFFGVMQGVAVVKPGQLGLLVGFCVVAIALGTLGQWIAHKGYNLFEERPKPLRSVLTAVLPLVALGLAWEYHDARALPGELGRKFEVIRIDQPNARDQIARERSYYEVLMAGGGEARAAAEEEDNVKDLVKDVRGRLYKESHGPVTAWGATWSSNRWRMRDQLYSKSKPPGTTRIAISGASYVMGRGVSDGETFESIVEEHMNEHGAKIQLLNFAMSATCTLQRLADFELRIAEFEPDIFFFICHRDEGDRNIRKIADIINNDYQGLTYPILDRLVKEEGIEPDMTDEEIIRKLYPHTEEIMAFTYSRIAELCAEKGIKPVWVYLPMITSQHREDLADPGRAYAKAAGIETLELHGCFEGKGLDELKVSEVDHHPNQLGHQLIAKRFLKALKDEREKLGLPESLEAVPPLR